MFPLKNYKYQIPLAGELGAFGAVRKHDIHTGVDLYCEEDTPVYAIEAGIIVSYGAFTGPQIDMPWWNDTDCVAIKGKSGIINYGEIKYNFAINLGIEVPEGFLVGLVKPVLKRDKGKVPSTSMLHIELYKEYSGEWEMWELGQPQPENLVDPTSLLKQALK